ncbi:MAG: hypothetical protein HKN26_07810, partial [Acidimicrobiales bacterium]|nr:hypothetical protein [Acidimicrobiales bacterium]
FTTLDEARAAIESAPPVRLLLEMGGDPQSLGGPVPRGELSFEAWPPPTAEPITWYLGSENALLTEPNNDGSGAAHSFAFDAENSQRVTEAADDDGNEFDNLAWEPLVEGNALAYETELFTDDLLLAGSGVVELWVASTADDADLQVTISEIRPDGQEMYIQTGWLRASHRALDDSRSSALLPFHTHAEIDLGPLPAGEFTPIQVEIFPAAHVVRAGSRLRLVIDSPGGTRNLWKFDVLEGPATHSVALTGAMPSSITLPFVRDAEVPVGLPPCPDTRSQPCRPYLTVANSPSALTP